MGPILSRARLVAKASIGAGFYVTGAVTANVLGILIMATKGKEEYAKFIKGFLVASFAEICRNEQEAEILLKVYFAKKGRCGSRRSFTPRWRMGRV